MINSNAKPDARQHLARWIALGSLLSFGGYSHAAIYTVGASGTGCTHATIQAAVAAAEASVGADTIRITRSLTYTAQQVTLNTAQDLNLVGGFGTCTDTASDGQKTVISGAGGGATSVFTMVNTATSAIKMRLLRITGGDAPADGYGGGINFNGNGSLELIEMAIDNNHAGYGGGVHFLGGNSDAVFIIGNDTLINGNAASISGGGVYFQRGQMTMTAPGSSIYLNTAVNYGGGLRLYGAAGDFGTRATVGSGGYGTLAAIEGNEARFGGGVAVQGLQDDGAGASIFTLQTVDAARPARISNNFASERGGAIDLQNFFSFGDFGDATASVGGGYLEGNIAPQAAAVYVGHDDDPLGLPRGSQFAMSGGRIVGNISANALNQPTDGAIVLDSEDGIANIDHAIIRNNNGGPILRAGSVRNDIFQVSLTNSSVTNNTVQGAVVSIESSGQIRITGTTIAGNTLTGSNVIAVANNIDLRRTIVWQPGKQTLQAGGSRVIDDVIASEVASLAGGPTVLLTNPRFIDPANADYGLRAASRAVDFSVATGGSGVDGGSHGVDLALVANFMGATDLGAYERPALLPIVLNGNFDIDTRLWPEVSAGASARTSDNFVGPAASGALVVSVDDFIGAARLVVRSQCVNIPGPGTYRLGGSGRAPGAAGSRDSVVLNWKYRPNSEACAGAITTEGDLFLPNANAWATAQNPAIIPVPSAQWTFNTTIEVSLVVIDEGIQLPRDFAGAFDGITLDATAEAPDALFANGFE